MRLQHWIVPAIGMVVALGGSRHVSAQYDPTRVVPADDPYAAAAAPAMSPFPYYDPAANGAYPAMQAGYYEPAAAPQSAIPPDWVEPGQVPNYNPLLVHPPDSAAFPPGFQPYPAISPYDHRFQQHYQDRGLWFQKTNDEQNKVYFSADAMVSRYRLPNSRLIGAPNVDTNIFPSLVSIEGLIAWDSKETREVFNHFDGAVGMQLRLAVVSADDGGMELKGWWGGELDQQVLFGDYRGSRANPEFLSIQNPAISLDDGTGGGPGTNASASMDKIVTEAYQVNATGVNLTHWTTPWVDRGSLKVRNTLGGRFMALQEGFRYRGTDAGMVYLVDPITFLHPIPGTALVAVPESVQLFHADTLSYLAGPEIGLQMELGGDNFLLRTETKAAVAANHERILIDGRGLGNNFLPGYDPTSSFRRTRDHSHVSPLFEQSVNANANVVQLIPFLNKMHIFENATVRVGYTFLAVGQVVRPLDSVVYNAPPVNPGITVRRTHWFMNSWNFGIEWVR